jgi:hypothetical protein
LRAEHESSSDGNSTRWSRFTEFWKTLPGILTGIAAVVGAAAALLTETHPLGGGEDAPATLTASGQPDGCRFRMTGPKDRARVTNRSGTSIAGTACKDDYVWIFDYPSGAQRYYRKNHAPLTVIGEEWSYEDEHVGALDDPVGTTYRIVAIRVGGACSRALESDSSRRGGPCAPRAATGWVSGPEERRECAERRGSEREVVVFRAACSLRGRPTTL